VNISNLQPRTPDARWADAIAILLAAAEGEEEESLEDEEPNNEMAPGQDSRRRCAGHLDLRRL